MTFRTLMAAGTATLLLAGCAAQPSTLNFYDECARANPTFVSMAQCGAANRNAWCNANGTCTADGNATTLYADSLVQSVRAHEMSEPEAQRRWIEYRADRVDAARQADLQRQAVLAVQSPPLGYGYGCRADRFGRCF